jgi:outer membrane protein OmpA-like peptidoglycan-associated protein
MAMMSTGRRARTRVRAATGRTVAVAAILVAGCATAPPRPDPVAAPAVLGGDELGAMRCLVVAPFEDASDDPRLGEVATAALAASLDPEQTRVFPVDDLRRLFRGTSLELPPGGVSPSLALLIGEKVKADGVLYGAVEGRAKGAGGLVVTVRLQAVAGRELLFADAAPVKAAEGEQLEVALRRTLLLAARPMLLKAGAPGEKRCFDPELVRRARVIRSAPVASALGVVPELAGPPDAAASPPIAPGPGAGALAALPAPAPGPADLPAAGKDPRAAKQAELVRKLEQGTRFVLEDVEFAGRTPVFSQEHGLGDLAHALAALPTTSVRLEVFVDATEDPNQDVRASMAQAMAAVRRLVALGVARERVAQEARGGESPIQPNFTSRGRMANRRIEVVAVKSR